jgi:hypothetical protein
MLDHTAEKFRGLVREPSTMTLAMSAVQRGTVRASTRADMESVVPTLAVPCQIDLDADELVGAVK